MFKYFFCSTLSIMFVICATWFRSSSVHLLCPTPPSVFVLTHGSVLLFPFTYSVVVCATWFSCSSVPLLHFYSSPYMDVVYEIGGLASVRAASLKRSSGAC